MPRALLIIGACLALLVAGCGDDSSTSAETSPATTEEQSSPETSGGEGGGDAKKTKPKVSVPDGDPPAELVVNDIEEGSGPEAKAGDEVTVQYVGVGYDSKQQFDASWDRGEPFVFPLGAGAVIPGWDQGVAGMKVGGRRELIIPSELAYGPTGSPPAIGPNETLIFVVDLVAIN